MNARLNSKGEELWQELRQHLDWNDGFALFFLFASNTQLTDIFKYRLERFFIGKTTRLQEITYQTDDSDWLEHTMLKLLNRDAQWRLLHAPVWIALHHTQDAQALTQYRQLLLRLNERRDVWRNAYPAPMIFVLPEVLKSEIARLIPDLWSVRIATEHWDESLLQVDSVSGGAQQPSVPVGVLTDAGRCAIPDVQQPVVDEWQRLLSKNGKIQRQHLIVASRALAVYQRYGWLADAQQAAALMEEWARELNQTDTPESLRDLSVSLDNVGQVGQQQGRWGDAQSAYEESLGIRRRLCAMLGDTPESLRDLAIANQNLALLYAAQDQKTLAVQYFYEEFALGKRLSAMLPNMPFYIEIEAYSRSQIEQLTGTVVE